MGTFVAIGAPAQVEGFALGGATVSVARTPEEVRAAWGSLPEEAAVVVLTAEAARALEPGFAADGRVLVAVMAPWTP